MQYYNTGLICLQLRMLVEESTVEQFKEKLYADGETEHEHYVSGGDVLYNTTDLCWKKIARNLIVSEGKVQDIRLPAMERCKKKYP